MLTVKEAKGLYIFVFSICSGKELTDHLLENNQQISIMYTAFISTFNVEVPKMILLMDTLFKNDKISNITNLCFWY